MIRGSRAGRLERTAGQALDPLPDLFFISELTRAVETAGDPGRKILLFDVMIREVMRIAVSGAMAKAFRVARRVHQVNRDGAGPVFF